MSDKNLVDQFDYDQCLEHYSELQPLNVRMMLKCQLGKAFFSNEV